MTQPYTDAEVNAAIAATVDELRSKADGYVDHIKSLQAEVEQLRAIKFQRFNNQDCWIYQGDGEDHLESLVCPVVVSPQKMMELQARIQQLETYSRCDAETIEQLLGRVAELEAENSRLVESLHKLIGKKSTLVTSKLP
jgi:uncharacterized coiled-coil protein SlyX